jgi:hypothetical protein
LKIGPGVVEEDESRENPYVHEVPGASSSQQNSAANVEDDGACRHQQSSPRERSATKILHHGYSTMTRAGGYILQRAKANSWWVTRRVGTRKASRRYSLAFIINLMVGKDDGAEGIMVQCLRLKFRSNQVVGIAVV